MEINIHWKCGERTVTVLLHCSSPAHHSKVGDSPNLPCTSHFRKNQHYGPFLTIKTGLLKFAMYFSFFGESSAIAIYIQKPGMILFLHHIHLNLLGMTSVITNQQQGLHETDHCYSFHRSHMNFPSNPFPI